MPIQFNQLYVNGGWQDAADGATLEGGIKGIPGDTICIDRIVGGATPASRQSLFADEA
jgi:hypothetical protein